MSSVNIADKGIVRLYNDHPTQAFLGEWNGIQYIHQPKTGRFVKVVERVPHPKHQGRKTSVTKLAIVPGTEEKKGTNWIDVPAEYAKQVTTNGLGIGRLSSATNDDGEVDFLHHGGHLRTQQQKDKDLEAAHAEAERKLEEKMKRLAELNEKLAAAEHQVGEKAAKAAAAEKSLDTLADDLKKKKS